MQVTTKLIESLNPCQDRLDNWLKHYPNWEGSLSEFLDLEHITHNDKAWVYFRFVDCQSAIKVAADIAESVLPIFEAQYPNDSRPRDAIEAARSGDRDRAASAANAAAKAAADAADAVDAAAKAAYTANVAAYCAAIDASAASRAYYAACSANKNQETVNIKLMKDALK